MKSKSVSSDPQPELQELLHKPRHFPLLSDTKYATIIPSQGSNKEKKRAVNIVNGDSPDVVAAVIGNYGRWQLLMTFMLSLFSFPCTFHIYLPTFTAYQSNFWCRRPENMTSLPLDVWINYSQPVDSCSVRDLTSADTVQNILNNTASYIDSFHQCTEWDYDRSQVGETIISEWNLVCDRAYLTSLAEVMFLVGVGVGGVVGGWISDKFGRKKILMAMMLAQCVLGILSLLVRSYAQYLGVRLVMGFVSVSVVYAAFVLVVELVGDKWVTISGVCNFFWLPVAYIVVTILSLFMPDWRKLQLSLSLPGFLLMGLWFVLPESPRWLLSMGRNQEAKLILERAAKFNKREIPTDIDKILLLHKPETVTSVGPSELFKGALRKRTTCLFLSWFSMTIAYYGLLLNIGKFNLGSLHVTSIILAVVEIPAIAISIPILLKAGRRFPIFISMVVCGTACVASELFTIFFDEKWLVIIGLTIGKFSIGATNMMLPIYTVELYPTIVRNLGVGASQVSAGCGLICIPYLWKLAILSPHLPMATIAVLAVFGGSIILLLPETTPNTQTIISEQLTPDQKKAALENSSPGTGTFTNTDNRGR